MAYAAADNRQKLDTSRGAILWGMDERLSPPHTALVTSRHAVGRNRAPSLVA